MKSVFIAFIGIASFLYLLNPTLGFFEFIPDALPYVGNLDEGAAVTLLLMSLRHFGLDLTRLFERKRKKEEQIES